MACILGIVIASVPALPNLLVGIAGMLLVGLTLGLLGAGGTAITVPVLVYIVGMEAHQAIALSIVLVGAASGLGTYLHSRKGAVRWRTAAAFAIPGIAGAALGSRLSQALPGRYLLIGFAVLLAISGARMLLDRSDADEQRKRRGWMVIAPAGLGIGLLTGLLGVGGGFVIVPALVYLGGLAMRESVATSLAIITVNSAAALPGHAMFLSQGAAMVLILLASAAAGMAGGTVLCHRLAQGKLKQLFALLLIGLALFMLHRNLPAIP